MAAVVAAAPQGVVVAGAPQPQAAVVELTLQRLAAAVGELAHQAVVVEAVAMRPQPWQEQPAVVVWEVAVDFLGG